MKATIQITDDAGNVLATYQGGTEFFHFRPEEKAVPGEAVEGEIVTVNYVRTGKIVAEVLFDTWEVK